MASVTLDIVVICLDERRHLPRCLRAINGANHAGLSVQVLVVDGGSTDRSRELARELGARVIDSPRGIPRQRNAGGRAATAQLLAYVDADVALTSQWFATVARRFADERRQLLGSTPQLPAAASWIARAYWLHWARPSGATQRIARQLSTQSLVMGREVFTEVDGFDERLRVDEDTDFVFRARARGVPVISDPALRYVHHGEPRDLRAFARRIAWGVNAERWLQALREADLPRVWRPQYLFGALVGAELGAVAASVAGGPLLGWPLGLPLAGGALAATIGLPALITAHRERAYGQLPALCAMFGVYGAATAAGLVRGRGPARWR